MKRRKISISDDVKRLILHQSASNGYFKQVPPSTANSRLHYQDGEKSVSEIQSFGKDEARPTGEPNRNGDIPTVTSKSRSLER